MRNKSPRFFTYFLYFLIYSAEKSEISEILKNLKNLEILKKNIWHFPKNLKSENLIVLKKSENLKKSWHFWKKSENLKKSRNVWKKSQNRKSIFSPQIEVSTFVFIFIEKNFVSRFRGNIILSIHSCLKVMFVILPAFIPLCAFFSTFLRFRFWILDFDFSDLGSQILDLLSDSQISDFEMFFRDIFWSFLYFFTIFEQ